MRAHKDAAQKDEALYIRLKTRKRNEFIKTERELYNTDPRFMLGFVGSTCVSVQKFISGEEIHEEDKIVYQMTNEEKEKIYALIEAFDTRAPFDLDKCCIEFERRQEMILNDYIEKIPPSLYEQIADPRVFALGYCTREILVQLKKQSHINNIKVDDMVNQNTKAMDNANIPEQLRGIHGFHDCQVDKMILNQDIILHLNTSGGFTDNNRIVFRDAHIMKQEKPLEGSYWLYEELYPQPNGYEVHMLFYGDEVHEFTMCCKDIMISKEAV